MFNRAYVTSVYGVLKYLECVCALLAWILFWVSSAGRYPAEYEDWRQFFFSTHVISSIVLPAVFIVSLFTDKLWCLWNIAVMIVHLTLAVCGLVTSSYWIQRAKDTLPVDRDKFWEILVLSLVFGFISSISLTVDFVLSFRKVRGYSDVQQRGCLHSRKAVLVRSPHSSESSE